MHANTTRRHSTKARRTAPAVVAGLAALSVAAGVAAPDAHAQERTRINKVIEAIEQGRPAIANQDWRFVDMEHSPFSAERIVEAFAEADQDRDDMGRLRLTPMVRIPQEGDEDFKWAIKQVLDLGGLGVIVPHVDTGPEAVRLVQAARYPPMQNDAQPEPRGERGWGPGRAARLWGVDTAEYHARADVWPLDPNGELFIVAMVESAEAVGNIQDILAAPVSAILVVPGDMSIDLGLGPAPGPENHPEVDAMYEKVLEACKAQDRVICGCGDGAARLQQRIDEGWGFILPLGG